MEISEHRADEAGPGDELKWQLLISTGEKLRELWIRLQGFPLATDALGVRTQDDFIDRILDRRSVFYEIGTLQGLAMFTEIRPGLTATAKFVMFDKKLRGREEIFKSTLSHVTRVASLRRVTYFAESQWETLIAFLDRCGFKIEGRLRNGSVDSSGNVKTMLVMGILREEIE